jgi:hypothetical protein
MHMPIGTPMTFETSDQECPTHEPRDLLGSIINTDSKFAHRLIMGPDSEWGRLVGHAEPGVGKHIERLGDAAQRYNLTSIVPTVNDQHGAESWVRFLAQVGEPWLPADNCRDTASKAYFGVPETPFYIAVGGVAAFLWLCRKN